MANYSNWRPTYENVGEWVNSGNSTIVDPDGTVLAGPLHQAEGILYADIDPEKLRATKWDLDVAGHYARPDIFALSVKKKCQPHNPLA